MPPVVLLNPFEVPEGQDEAFLAGGSAKAFMERQPGYIATPAPPEPCAHRPVPLYKCGRVGHDRVLSNRPQSPRVCQAPRGDTLCAFPCGL